MADFASSVSCFLGRRIVSEEHNLRPEWARALAIPLFCEALMVAMAAEGKAMTRTIIGFILITASLLLWIYVLSLKIDTPGELASIRFVYLFNIILSIISTCLIFGVTLQRKCFRQNILLIYMIIIIMILACIIICYIEIVVTARWAADPKNGMHNRIGKVHIALRKYALDMGSYPTQNQGLDALVRNADGSSKWAGPYVTGNGLLDFWGNKLQYSITGEQVDVWSVGPDGVSGTNDDMR